MAMSKIRLVVVGYGMDRPMGLPIDVTPCKIEEFSRHNPAAMFGHGGADA